MNRNLSLLLSLFGAASIFSSCALIFHGTKQEVRFNCTKDAEVKLNMNVVGRTNQLVVIPRKDLDGLVRISAPGCETKELMLPLKTTPATWLDIPWILVPYGNVFYDTDVAFGSDIATENEINVELNCK
jgi:hypothetical protein